MTPQPRKKRGRPARSDESSERVTVRFTQTERKTLEIRAQINGQTLSDYIRSVVLSDESE